VGAGLRVGRCSDLRRQVGQSVQCDRHEGGGLGRANHKPCNSQIPSGHRYAARAQLPGAAQPDRAQDDREDCGDAEEVEHHGDESQDHAGISDRGFMFRDRGPGAAEQVVEYWEADVA
jgi:hypothetical protein